MTVGPLCFRSERTDETLCANTACDRQTECSRFSLPPRDPEPAEGAAIWQDIASKNRPVKCADCAKWTSCPSLALRNKRTGCSHFVEKDWTHEVEEIGKPEYMSALDKIIDCFADKDARIKELEEQLEEANRKVETLQESLDTVREALG